MLICGFEWTNSIDSLINQRRKRLKSISDPIIWHNIILAVKINEFVMWQHEKSNLRPNERSREPSLLQLI